MAGLLVPHVAGSAPLARHALFDALAAAGIASTFIDDACLVLAELVGNAVRHGAALPDGSVAVVWTLTPGRLRLEVTDGGGGDPETQPFEVADGGGRGLRIVASLSAAWGVRHERVGTTAVWADLVVPPAGHNGGRPSTQRRVHEG